MSRAAETPESPETALDSMDTAGTPKNRHKGNSPLRKALAAAVVGAFVLGGAAFASHGFTENPVDVVASQIHGAQADGGAISSHNATDGGGLGSDAAKAALATKTEPAAVPVAAQQAQSDRIATISIPRLWGDSTRFVVEGASDTNLGSPGTDNPNAVADFETAIAHNTGTQLLGDLGNVGLEGHRTANTFGRIDTLRHGDIISVTDTKTGTVYTYAVSETMQDNPAIGRNPKTQELGLPYITAADQDKASSVMDPIPFDDNSWSAPGHPATTQPKQRLLTLTSCGLDYETTQYWRVYVIAELQSVTAGKAGA